MDQESGISVLVRNRMRGIFNIVFYALLVSSSLGVNGQSKYEKITSALLSADSVFIVSHEDTGGFTENNDGSAAPLPPLILANKLNQSIIHESLLLRRESVNELYKILAIERDRYSEFSANCFNPHHSIVIVSRGHYSCIEICFRCRRVKAPADLNFYETDMGDRKWKKLIHFFKGNNFNYELKQYR